MRLQCLLPAVLAAVLLSEASSQLLDCDLNNPQALSQCIKTLLINSRDKVRQKADPLHLDDFHFNDGDTRGSGNNVVVRGLSGYSVDHLSLTFPEPAMIAVRATISWPGLRGTLDAKLRGCTRVLFKICGTVRGRPEINIEKTTGTLSTVLSITVTPEGQLVATSSDTKVTINPSDIHVKPNLRGFTGFLVDLFTNPERIINREVNKWWNNNKRMVEMKAEEALDDVVKKELSVNLAKLLKVGSVNVPVSNVTPPTPSTTTARRPLPIHVNPCVPFRGEREGPSRLLRRRRLVRPDFEELC